MIPTLTVVGSLRRDRHTATHLEIAQSSQRQLHVKNGSICNLLIANVRMSHAREVRMLHSDLFPEFGCDGELIDLPEQSTRMLTVKRCEKCWTELVWVADEEH